MIDRLCSEGKEAKATKSVLLVQTASLGVHRGLGNVLSYSFDVQEIATYCSARVACMHLPETCSSGLLRRGRRSTTPWRLRMCMSMAMFAVSGCDLELPPSVGRPARLNICKRLITMRQDALQTPEMTRLLLCSMS